jgi:formylglycine-generating enzyme
VRRLPVFTVMLRLALSVGLVGVAARAEATPRTKDGSALDRMVHMPAGTLRPLYGSAAAAPLRIAGFRLDSHPVTRGQYLAFVRAAPQWKRSAVKAIFADRASYLADWNDDLDAGDAAALDRPVTGVSWHAARAYCQASGRRLPTVAEWEYAAAASATTRDAARQPAFIQQLVSSYASRPRELPSVLQGTRNAYGISGLHDFTWEWTEDFNSVLVSDDSRGVGAREHALFCASAAIGALDPDNFPAFLRYAMRAGVSGRTALQTLGFRCAA